MALTEIPIELSSTPSIVDGGNATAITIDSSENVGIGVTNPADYYAKDLVIGAADEGGITIESATTEKTYLLFADGTSGDARYRGFLGYDHSIDVFNVSSNGYINFLTGDTGANAERMRIDASGRVGIGATPSANWSGNDVLQMTYGAFTSSSSFGAAVSTNIVATAAGWPTKYLATGAASAYLQAVSDGSHLFYTAASGSAGASAPLSERVRINAAGQLLIGTATGVATGTLATSGLEVVAPSGQDAIATQVLNGATCFGGSGPTTSSQTYLFGQMVNSSGSTVGSIVVSASATAYNTSSDYRLKENVVAISNATERLKQLNPSRFNFIEDADTTVDGFLAHEVQDVVPEAISGTKDAMRDEEYEVTPAVLDDDGNVTTEAVMGTRSVPDYQGIDQSKLVPLLVATIQELEARLTALENN